MTGGLLQLAFKGPQDVHLTGNPQMTYFKSVYKNHSNFSKDSQFLQLPQGSTFSLLRFRQLTIFANILASVVFPTPLVPENK